MNSGLLQKTGIAGAVAREIHRADAFSHYSHAEGLAYKAEIDRQGGNAMKCCNDFAADCAVMDLLLNGCDATNFVIFESMRGAESATSVEAITRRRELQLNAEAGSGPRP